MILDSGNRTKFESGAVRDVTDGKGRCDLLPLGVVGSFFEEDPTKGWFFFAISDFQKDGNVQHLYDALESFSTAFKSPSDMFLELAVHFEEGCKKYGERNWEKGIPVKNYINSAVRHCLKFIRGDSDERHDRACAWNICCAIWTCQNLPYLNCYDKKLTEEKTDDKR